ncbi:MAG: aminoacetone oxidase family FAD-binding enzyme [Clostridiales bacterium]|nr:aminoacetone oxidase family FAD-binding enzyme [Clostridiales bacterium]
MGTQTDGHSYDVVIVGGGASGLFCASYLRSRSEDLSILILEGSDRVANKLLLTGSGRCNLTNTNWGDQFYNSDDPAKVRQILQDFTPDDLTAFFRDVLGVYTVAKDGYVYPKTFRSNTVSEAFRSYLKENNVTVITNEKVSGIIYDGKYMIRTLSGNSYSASHLVLSTGGVSYPRTGSDGTGFRLVMPFLPQDAIEPLRSALLPLTAGRKDIKALSGIRVNAALTLLSGSSSVDRSEGELLFTDNGLSGICVFQLSSKVSAMIQEHINPVISVDYLMLSREEALPVLEHLKESFPDRTISAALSGLIRPQISEYILKTNGLDLYKTMAETDINDLYDILTGHRFDISGTGDITEGQVTAGGVKLSYLDQGLQIKDHPGLYTIGEMVNVDGICGGYNLQWAFSSAASCADKILKG